MTQLKEQLVACGATVKECEPLSAHTSFRIGGAARLFVTVDTLDTAVAVWKLCHEQNVPMLVLGSGSNLLVRDEGFDGVVIHPLAGADGIVIDGTTVTAHAGVPLSKLCTAVCEAGLSGLEFAYGIPGAVGGAAYMNAGAYGGELADTVTAVTAIMADGRVTTVEPDCLDWGYRHSAFMEWELLIWSVTFELTPAEPTAIREKMDGYLAARREKQPLEYPSAGSFFKRPTGYFAGALIEQCGLKGFAVGGAQISEKHAGFVINRGGATCADVLALCEAVQARVWDTHGVQLEREVQLV